MNKNEYRKTGEPEVGGPGSIAPKATPQKGYLWASAALLAFALVYGYFSHGVWSVWMLGAFVIPLLWGYVPSLLEAREGKKRMVSGYLRLWGVACFSVGAVMSGVLEIYGTTNRLLLVYFLAATVFFASALICWPVKSDEDLG